MYGTKLSARKALNMYVALWLGKMKTKRFKTKAKIEPELPE